MNDDQCFRSPEVERVAFLESLMKELLFGHGLQGNRARKWLCECFLNSFL